MSAEERLKTLAITLPPAPRPVANYVTSLQIGRSIHVSGHGPLREDRTLITGRVGDELSIEEGVAAARQTGLAILATLKSALGSLDRIERVVKLLGMVWATPDFRDHPKVINGCSDLFVEIFGEEHGRGARSAVGMGSLPGGISVEIEAEFLLREEG